MENRPLGRTGMQVSRFGLGAMVLGAWGNTDRPEWERIINSALDAIDQVVPAGHTINPADTGWVSPGLSVEARRRG